MSKGADKSAKDKQMAARMKQEGITRKTCRCPMCHGLINIKSYASHLGVCRRDNT